MRAKVISTIFIVIIFLGLYFSACSLSTIRNLPELTATQVYGNLTIIFLGGTGVVFGSKSIIEWIWREDEDSQ